MIKRMSKVQKVQKVLSFIKLFEHEALKELSLTELYKETIEVALYHAGVHEDVIFTRIETFSEAALIVAYRRRDHKTWLSFFPSGIREGAYEWRTREHSIRDTKWDISFIAPEFELCLNVSRYTWSDTSLLFYTNILGFLAEYIDSEEGFIQLINDSLIETKDINDVFYQTYNGEMRGHRLGEFSFITGQENGRLIESIRRVFLHLDKGQRDADIHLLPYLGTLIPNADFDTLTEILKIIDDNDLGTYPTYTLSHERAHIITKALEKVKAKADKKLKDLMENHVQTVTISQLNRDDKIKDYIKSGAKVNILIDLDKMEWVD